MTPVPFTSRADAEYLRAFAYYYGHGRAAEFDRAVDDAARRIAADPASLPIHSESDRLRRIPVQNFPYDLLFVIEATGPTVVSVWNHHRNPADLPRG